MTLIRNGPSSPSAYLWNKQGEFLEPVLQMVTVSQTGFHQGAAVSPAHQEPHGIVSDCKRRGTPVSTAKPSWAEGTFISVTATGKTKSLLALRVFLSWHSVLTTVLMLTIQLDGQLILEILPVRGTVLS